MDNENKNFTQRELEVVRAWETGFREGKSAKQIAATLGMKTGSLTTKIGKLRRSGLSLTLGGNRSRPGFSLEEMRLAMEGAKEGDTK